MVPGYRTSIVHILREWNMKPETDAKHSGFAKQLQKEEEEASDFGASLLEL